MKNLISMGLIYKDHQLWILDQRKLPHQESWNRIENPQQMIEAIQTLQVRGAPLIGVAAAITLADFAFSGASYNEILESQKALSLARPTAVNLMLAMKRMFQDLPKQNYSSLLVERAEEIFDEDVKLCNAMAEQGSTLIRDGENILTHCNTGGLATVGIGTALGVIRNAFESGKKIHVYVDETRPLLQGSRLTCWELEKLKIPYTLICDNMAAHLMKNKKVDKIFVGADRIAANGDFANKVGTYSLAINAHFHQIPFYVVAPSTTVDLNCLSGAQIPIEERNSQEVRGATGEFGNVNWSPINAPIFNPAFDVTPVELITALVIDHKILTRQELMPHIFHKFILRQDL